MLPVRSVETCVHMFSLSLQLASAKCALFSLRSPLVSFAKLVHPARRGELVKGGFEKGDLHELVGREEEPEATPARRGRSRQVPPLVEQAANEVSVGAA